jgi:hypothetical protein
MQTGNTFKTVNHKVRVLWSSTGTNRDFTVFNKVGSWLGKNGRALDKKTPHEVVKEISDQFPEVNEVECEDSFGRIARMVKP